MRLGVIDVGSNTVHFLVVDAYYGGHPLPAYSHKVELKLSENLLPDGTIGAEFGRALTQFLTECQEIAEEQGVIDLMAFATSAIRDAHGGQELIETVSRESGVDLPGSMSTKELIRTDGTREMLPSKISRIPVKKGDMLVYRTAGGGGWKEEEDMERG